MDVLYRVCCGLDVHKKTVAACLRSPGPKDRRAEEVRTFGTTTHELLRLADWLTMAGCTHVAMESTGVYWRPVYHILEGSIELLLVNAQHVKAVPGRKTDVRDCQWIAQLLEHGLLRASFVPPAPFRELRELTRSRRQLIQEHTREANRVQKVLETANIKLGDVAADVLGASGRAMLKALVAGERDTEKLAALARGRLRDKAAQLREALVGRVTDHHAFLLDALLSHIDFLEQQIELFDGRIEEQTRPYATALERLDTITGVARRSAEQILAELGDDMTRFPTAGHAASWAGICPGNHESAGKRKSGKTRKGDRWLRATLVECARGAVRAKKSYLAAQYHRLARRRGDKTAIVAVGHSILVAAWHILREGVPYRDLGGDHFGRLNREQLVRYHTRRLADLGVVVPPASAAIPA
ncbi:MAG: IS110 family transposase [Candidatus Rokubacteria bacterium]|nr:IS110 family transposase [Candidatus Rokubacteria bacterium]